MGSLVLNTARITHNIACNYRVLSLAIEMKNDYLHTETSPFHMPGMGLVPYVRSIAQAKAPALIESSSGEVISYAALLTRIDSSASQFRSLPQSIAFLATSNSSEAITTYLALLEAGHVVCLISDTTGEHELCSLIERYQPNIIAGRSNFNHPEFLRLHTELTLPVYARTMAVVLELNSDLAVLLSTSGSTGSSKLVKLSHTNILSNAHSIKEYLGLTQSERAITTLPFSYSYGLSVLHSHLVTGASIITTTAGLVTREFWQSFKEHNATSLAGVPYSYQMMHKLGVFRRPPASLRYATQAGGRLDPQLALEIHTQLATSNVSFYVMYGQTEATARISYLPPGHLSEKLGSIGIAIPGGTLSVTHTDGSPCADGTLGEITYSGTNVMMGYAENAGDLALGDQMLGSLKTGDLGYRDADGFFFLTGRSKRIAKILGLRVSLDEVEALLERVHPIAVIEHGEKLVCYHEGASDTQIIDMARLLIERVSLDRDYFEFCALESIPRKSNGKFDYIQLGAL